MSVLPQHKTDAIFRVENLDRYDDRDVIITNLLETYDRLIAFGQKHLSDPFVQEAMGNPGNQRDNEPVHYRVELLFQSKNVCGIWQTKGLGA